MLILENVLNAIRQLCIYEKLIVQINLHFIPLFIPLIYPKTNFVWGTLKQICNRLFFFIKWPTVIGVQLESVILETIWGITKIHR